MRRKILFRFWHLAVLFIFLSAAPHLLSASYRLAAVGAAPDGSLTASPDGYDLTSRSRDIGGTSDQFEFAYEARTGDFDIQTRIAGVTVTDAFVRAGLMARPDINGASPFAAVFSSSALLGTFFESRLVSSGTAQQVSPAQSVAVNYPQTYLRLKRNGSVFSGFASLDGNSWRQLGTATINLPAQILVGMAVASLNTNAVARAQFRDINDVSNPSAFLDQPAEKLGASSRRTGLVFSEIMYHPAPRSDGEDLEFIEIFNAESVFIDLTGWRLAGAVDYQFPDSFRLESGQFAVVAAKPDSIARIYGYQGTLGPYKGHLNNQGETLMLLNRSGATRLEVPYQSTAPWPVAADGTGHSLVLARPSYGESDPRAWAASDRVGGSPGEVDAHWPNPSRHVVINELLANGGGPAGQFVELYNASVATVDLSGCFLTIDPAAQGFRIPDGTILSGQGFAQFSEAELSFAIGSGGNTLYLFSPSRDRVIDLIRFSAQENGVSFGRAPDGSPKFARLASPTPMAANASRRLEEVVINEVMYHSITEDDANTYVELHNASTNAVEVGGWTLSGGIAYQIPDGWRIPAGGFLVVAKDAAHLMSIYPQLNTNNTAGNFNGKLSHNGEYLALANHGYVESELTYGNGGRWPELADAGGSSLELTDPRADTTLAGNWAASDESGKSSWTTVDVTARLEMGTSAYAANRLQILLQGAGECLVDDVEFIPAGSTNVLVNGDLETETNSWRFFGNHSQSAIEAGAAFAGKNGLHVRSPGDGDTANNTIRGTLVRTISTGGTATLRAKVRWLAGWPEVLFRLRGNWFEAPIRMDIPRTLGTPGLPNSRRVPNGPPAIYDVAHSPALPRASEAVIVTCRVADPDGIAAPRLLYRIDPSQTLTTVVMRDDGLNGDALAGDGIYSGTIPGKVAHTMVAFRIQTTDSSPQSATALFPPDAPRRECLIVWEDAVPFGTFAHYHMWSTAATEAVRAATKDLDNTYRDTTLVCGNARIIYNTGFRDKGSPFHNGGGDFAVTVPGDQPLLGEDDRVFASTGNGGNEATDMKGDLAGWVGEQMGIPFLHSHYMRLYRNGATTPYREVMYDMEQPSRAFAKSWFGGGGIKDDLYKIAMWFEFDDSNSNFSNTGATLQNFVSNGQYKLARYRWNWQLRASTGTANDYTNLFTLVAAANSATERTRAFPQLADVEEWMRVLDYERVIGNWDSWTYNEGQNMYLYAPLGLPAALLPWDIDFVLGDGDGPAANTLFTSSDSTLQQIFNLPVYKRMLWRGYQDAVAGPLITAKFQPQIDARGAVLRKNNVSSSTSTGVITSYMNGRRTYLAGQLAKTDIPALAVTSNNGHDLVSTNVTMVLSGVAPIAVASLEVNGVPFAANWTSVTNWQISVPLVSGPNALQVTGRDLRGQLLTNAVAAITIQYNVQAAQPRLLVSLDKGTVTVSWQSLSGRAYRIETSSAIDLPQWITKASGVGDGGPTQFIDPLEQTHSRFYRVVLTPGL